MSDSFCAKPLFGFACPFCSLDCQVAQDVVTDESSVSHAIPACERFLAIDAVEFVAQARRTATSYGQS